MTDLLSEDILADMQQVDQLVHQALESDIALITRVGKHIFNGRGKRLRPMILVLSARACCCQQMEVVHHLAAIIEIIHVTTLLHDDVIDNSKTRRGKPTANMVFGNAASILVGDFLYSRVFQMMLSLDNMPVMRILSKAANIIVEGEILQLENIGNVSLTESDYLKVIRYKTSKLFEVSAQLGAILADASEKEQQAFVQYGGYIGTAFQIIDDLLDFSGNYEATGKDLGNDLAEGKLTLPLIYAIEQGTPRQAEAVRRAIKKADRTQLPEIIDIVNQTEALTLTLQCAENLAEQAISAISELDDSVYKETLIQLAHFVLKRDC